MFTLADFDFELPAAQVAIRPLAERDASRMLVVDGPRIVDQHIYDLLAWVRAGDIWVINDTKVIPARLLGSKVTGGKVELLLLEPLGEHRWLAWAKSNKPLKVYETIAIAENFTARVVSKEGKDVVVQLVAEDVASAIQIHGHMPLPPYIERPDCEEDQQRYQTVFAQHEGAVAAPTAGLHLTQSLMGKMQNLGATFVSVTLHVGPGTFQPVQVDDVSKHVMHEERYVISAHAAKTINAANEQGHRIVAVGTTCVRTLESATDREGVLHAGAGRTDIFIYPGYQMRMVDALLTNFHLPRSTLLMLVAAMIGRERVLDVYHFAIAQGYRFYSYGDAMLIPLIRSIEEVEAESL
ncbi:MAG: tRNA preQ1(34) S-adenosylmethionine ribosyltransferase-isomerase QueA [Zetaproteobacteria bacterium]|nr:tRNA preQ1(34) S-adenosylmethionine ribosyltransferase-isomerase QueA [Zetaproteobacteria bacterium]